MTVVCPAARFLLSRVAAGDVENSDPSRSHQSRLEKFRGDGEQRSDEPTRGRRRRTSFAIGAAGTSCGSSLHGDARRKVRRGRDGWRWKRQLGRQCKRKAFVIQVGDPLSGAWQRHRVSQNKSSAAGKLASPHVSSGSNLSPLPNLNAVELPIRQRPSLILYFLRTNPTPLPKMISKTTPPKKYCLFAILIPKFQRPMCSRALLDRLGMCSSFTTRSKAERATWESISGTKVETILCSMNDDQPSCSSAANLPIQLQRPNKSSLRDAAYPSFWRFSSVGPFSLLRR